MKDGMRLFAALLGMAIVCWPASAGSLPGRRAPVIVELFTSEGCSSCPPADAVLARLDRDQPVASARIIAIAEHVDYWDHLGWRDPFSSAQYSARQNEYALAMHAPDIYTPQMVVNGGAAFLGADLDKARVEIARAARERAADIELSAAPRDGGFVGLVVHVSGIRRAVRKDADVYLAVTEDHVHSRVAAGENAGRRLDHVALARSFGRIGTIDPEASDNAALTETLRLPKEWKRADLHVIVFAQDRATRRVVGAGITTLPHADE